MVQANYYAVYMMGGLGNQIFQYLFALQLRERSGLPVLMLADWYQSNALIGRDLNRPLLLQKLRGINLPISTLGLAAEAGVSFPCIYRFEDEGGSENWPSLDRGNVLAIGYFQSVASMPSVSSMDKFCSEAMLGVPANSSNTVAIHLRLGDYRLIQNVLPVLPVSYYESALLRMPRSDRYLVFAEDVQEAREYLEPLSKRYDFEFKIPSDSVDDFLALASSSAIIGANSTFSYVAGLMAARRGARVVMPLAGYWHGPEYQGEVAKKEGLLRYANFELVA